MSILNEVIQRFALLLVLLAKSQLSSGSSSVSLTVEGGVSLVGPHCPGTVRLFCEGVNLTTLTWIYNGNIEIADTYFSDDPINTQKTTSNPAFLSVQLIAVSQSTTIFANFSSILTVNLSQLEQQGIRNISCGDPSTMETVPVGVRILRESVPSDPQFDNVTLLEDQLIISWEKVQPVRGGSLLMYSFFKHCLSLFRLPLDASNILKEDLTIE